MFVKPTWGETFIYLNLVVYVKLGKVLAHFAGNKARNNIWREDVCTGGTKEGL